MKTSKVMQILIAVAGLVFLLAGNMSAQIFPRVSFADPYFYQWYYNRPGPPNPVDYSDSTWYLPQMERLGITHTVTKGDNIGLGAISSPIKVFNDYKGYYTYVSKRGASPSYRKATGDREGTAKSY